MGERRATLRAGFDLSLYLISDPELCAGLGVVDSVLAAVRGGATLVQLRDPLAPAEALAPLARELCARLRPLGVPLIVNDRVELSVAVGADGAHVGQADMPASEARARLGASRILGLSITCLADLERCDQTAPDYLGVGPIFATRTKPDAAPALGLSGLREIAARARLPLCGIGGIDAENAASVIEHGGHGVAVVSAICGRDDPEAAARALALEVARAQRSAGDRATR